MFAEMTTARAAASHRGPSGGHRCRSVRHLPLVAGLVLAVLALSGCGDDVDPPPAISLDGTEWSVTAATVEDTTRTPVDGYPAAISIDAGELRGSTGCNSFGATLSISADGRVDVGGLAVTEIACDEPVMAFEATLLRALTSVDRIVVDGDRLRFGTADDSAGINLVARS